jgi:hypothetical protein
MQTSEKNQYITKIVIRRFDIRPILDCKCDKAKVIMPKVSGCDAFGDKSACYPMERLMGIESELFNFSKSLNYKC